MSFWSTIFLALGLAMDAFAVSISGGMASDRVNFVYALKITFFFALFQMLMPLLGWWLGNNAVIYIEPYAHWVAFFLLLLIGAKMVYESFQNKGNKQSIDFNKIIILLFLAFATSIDAFISGICISFLEFDIIKVIVVIGIITLLLSFLGVCIGKVLGYLLERYAEMAGGIILIIIGVKVLSGYIRGCHAL